ncbi:hypothetical protein MMC26_004837 [Xylographa opegraphella]|nr:hypothetical protein [Xylographa opegraphella]
MPYTIDCFLWRAPHLTPTEFKTHYETKHVPLLRAVTGPVSPQTHTRYYLPKHTHPSPPDSLTTTTTTTTASIPTVLMGTPENFSYNVIAKLVFEDEKAFQAFHTRLMEPDVSKLLGEDEGRFMVRGMLRTVRVEDGVVTVREA